MIRTRPASERGHANYGWLVTSHTFSFNTYHDPAHMGFRSLRVINEDVINPGEGFGMHGHQDMEIVTYVTRGALEHRDSLGNGGIVRAGDLQCMTAGTGIRHGEFNPSSDEPVHLYQIWLLPERRGLPPSYDQRAFPSSEETQGLRLVVSPDGHDGSLTIHQNARLFLGTLEAGEELEHPLEPARHAWIQVVTGSMQLGEQLLKSGDGAAVRAEPALPIKALEPVHFMLFDLA